MLQHVVRPSFWYVHTFRYVLQGWNTSKIILRLISLGTFLLAATVAKELTQQNVALF